MPAIEFQALRTTVEYCIRIFNISKSHQHRSLRRKEHPIITSHLEIYTCKADNITFCFTFRTCPVTHDGSISGKNAALRYLHYIKTVLLHLHLSNLCLPFASVTLISPRSRAMNPSYLSHQALIKRVVIWTSPFQLSLESCLLLRT